MYTKVRMLFMLIVILLPAPSLAAKPVDEVPFRLGLGQSLYEENCSNCHGTWGDGSDSGPPLMHKLYAPSHHDDKSFYRAALQGVAAHHWSFGDMPPVPGISRRALDKIVPYVRWLQRQNGIYR